MCLRFRRFAVPAVLALLAALLPTGVPADEVKVEIDAARPGAVIDPLLYSEFIEHLGRCIYGGIWAEMLRDRKFLLPLKESPWKVVEPSPDFEAKADAAGAFAGVPCMALWLRAAGGKAHGIRQEGLGVVAGKEYRGSIWLASIGDSASVAVRLAWGPGAAEGASVSFSPGGPAYERREFAFSAGATTDGAALSISVDRPAYVWIGAVSLMPADNVRGMRPDTLELVKQLAPPLVRWPGGNFVSGYDWKDGIGPRDRRPSRYEKAWNDIEPNDFGLDEFMDFCREVATQPYICVNAGLGSAEQAAEEVEYANGTEDTRWGSRRARNGHAEPYGVKVWGIGNEMYGDWQLGNVGAGQYVLRHVAFAKAMRARDPSIRLIGVGAPGPWNDALIGAAPWMDWLSEHYYQERKLRVPLAGADLEAYRASFPGYAGTVAGGIRSLVAAFRAWQAKAGAEGARVRLAIDEWGIVRDWNAAPDGPGLGSFEHYYTMGDALDVANGLHEILRAADVCTMANWAQTVNVIGLIKTSRTAASMEPPGRVLQVYRRHFGDVLLPASVAGGAAVDAVASRSKDGSELAIGLVNSSAAEAARVSIPLPSVQVESARVFRIAGPGVEAINVPGQPETVTLRELDPAPWTGSLDLPAATVTLVRLKIASR
jgi:alpha-N-arabinofuranosidase